MTETPATSEPPTGPVVTSEPVAQAPATPVVPERRQSRVVQAAAWVGIVAGVVFIVTVIFGTGFVLGAHSGGGDHHRGGHGDRHGVMMFHRGGPPPMMAPAERMFPPFGPGGGPEFRPPSAPDRPEAPTPTAPARP
ncbi:hypothetical protein ACRCUN_22200 [Mycobacterium sp. LTG2003]